MKRSTLLAALGAALLVPALPAPAATAGTLPPIEMSLGRPEPIELVGGHIGRVSIFGRGPSGGDRLTLFTGFALTESEASALASDLVDFPGAKWTTVVVVVLTPDGYHARNTARGLRVDERGKGKRRWEPRAGGLAAHNAKAREFTAFIREM